MRELDEFVNNWWALELGEDEPMPEDQTERISIYFEKTDESYEMETSEVIEK